MFVNMAGSGFKDYNSDEESLVFYDTVDKLFGGSLIKGSQKVGNIEIK